MRSKLELATARELVHNVGTNCQREEAAVIALSMFGSLVFGVVNHSILETPDHVSAIPGPAWRHAFIASAALVSLTEAVSMVMGSSALIRGRQPSL
ncbi:MAG: hypothetical protein U0872_11960 [Planctomycetaceae bacterium]